MIPASLPRTDIADEKLNVEENITNPCAPPRPRQYPDRGTQSNEDCDDECVEHCQGTFRWTRRNKVLLKTLRELLFKEVLTNLQITLDPDVISSIVIYTFEPTHSFVPHIRIDCRPSLTRGENFMDLLRCDPDFELNPLADYTLRKLIGRTFYGFEIHDSPYARVDVPNPCELMTKEGGVFLVPETLCYWFLNQDQDGSVPVRCRFNHRIVDAKVIFYVTGPYLQLSLTPIFGVTDGLLLKSSLESPRLFEESDEESFSSTLDISDIDKNLLTKNLRRSSTNDTLAIEIANSWKDTRESVLVIVPQGLHGNMMLSDESEDDSSVSEEPVQQMRVLNNPGLRLQINDSLELALEDSGSMRKVDGNKSNAECLTASDNSAGRRNVTSTETTKTSSTIEYQDTPCTVTSAGSVVRSAFRDDLTLEADILILEEPGGVKKNNMGMRPSITQSNPHICVLELGAGFVGSQNLSLSFHHNKATPNPHCNLSLDSYLDLEIED